MSADDARRVRELEQMCTLLERAILLQEKRIWSQLTLKLLDKGDFMAGASTAERGRTREVLEANLRVASEVLDDVALDLGYETPTVFKVLDPEHGGYGGAREGVPERLTEQLERIDARERESGSSHMRAMFRDLTARHDEFLSGVQEQVRHDVDLNAQLSSLVPNSKP
jgi:hypothetical protein